jgi:hypothetical protein
MIFVVLLSAGCVVTASSYCEIAKPIRWESHVELNATPTPVVRQIVTHNEVWARLCR